MGEAMTQETLATLLTGLGVIVAVWAIVRREVDGVRREVDGVRRDLGAQIAAVNTRVDGVRRDLAAQLTAVNTEGSRGR